MKGFIRLVYGFDANLRQRIDEFSSADGLTWQQTRGATLQLQPNLSLTVISDPAMAAPVALVS